MGGAGFVLRNSRACGRSKVHRGREAKGWAQGRAGCARRSRTPEGPVSRDLCREDEGAGVVGGGGIQRASAEVLVHLPAEDSPSPKGRWGCQASRTEAGGGRGRACGWELNGPEKAPIKLENYGET